MKDNLACNNITTYAAKIFIFFGLATTFFFQAGPKFCLGRALAKTFLFQAELGLRYDLLDQAWRWPKNIHFAVSNLEGLGFCFLFLFLFLLFFYFMFSQR